jgi:hypothetical protein
MAQLHRQHSQSANLSLSSGMQTGCATVLLLLINATRLLPTEFGGAADLPVSTNTIETVLVPQWQQTGALSWIRSSSPVLASHGFNQVAIVRRSPPPSPRNGRGDLPDDLLALYWHCRTNLPVYPNIQQAWEVWNEPDFYFVRENPDRMASVLKAAYWGIKAGNSNAIVLMPSMAFTPDKYQRELLRNNAFSFTEGYNFHFYGWAQDFLASLRQHQRFQDEHGLNLPLWVTEAGYFQLLRTDARDPAELGRQQAFHERLAITAYTAGAQVYLPFILTPYVETGFDMSLVNDDLSPRPALTSYLSLSRFLPQTKPLYQIWHRPTDSEIGCVLREQGGNWRTVFWTPHRWKDILIPGEQPSSATNSEPDNPRTTDLSLRIAFSSSNQIVHLGLESPKDAGSPRELNLTANVGHNAYLRTSPFRFEISDCEWRPVARIVAAEVTRLTSLVRENAPLTGNLSLGTPAATNVGSTQVKGKGASEGLPKQPKPSAVILQMNFRTGKSGEPADTNVCSTIVPDKASQTYQFESGKPIAVTVSLYNLAERDKEGEWRLRLHRSWTATVLSDVERGAESDRPPVPARGTKLAATQAQLKLPPLSRTDIPLLLWPPPADTADSDRLLVAAPRWLIECQWKGMDTTADAAGVWVEPRLPFREPSTPFKPELWLPNPQYPNQWEMTTEPGGVLRLVLRERPPPDHFASVFYVLPDDVRLNTDDFLCGELRVGSSRHIYCRINLLTPKKESFRYTEDQAATPDWSRIQWRIGDFGPTLWSALTDNFTLPVRDLCYVRISLVNLQVGDWVQLRNWGGRRLTPAP